MVVTVQFMIPVGVAVVNPLVSTVTHLFYDPWTIRILSLVIDTGKKLHHIVVSIVTVWSSTCICLPEKVYGIY